MDPRPRRLPRLSSSRRTSSGRRRSTSTCRCRPKPAEGIRVGWLEGDVRRGARADARASRKRPKPSGGSWSRSPTTSADPQSLNAAMQQAVDQGVDYIVVSGSNSPSYESALAAAKAADIPLVQIDIAAEEDAEAEGHPRLHRLRRHGGGVGAVLGNWIIADSDATANVVYVTIPEFSSLIPEGAALEETLDEGCAECTFDDVGVDDRVLHAPVASPARSPPTSRPIPTSTTSTSPSGRWLPVPARRWTRPASARTSRSSIADPDLTGMQGIIDGKHQAGVNLLRRGSHVERRRPDGPGQSSATTSNRSWTRRSRPRSTRRRTSRSRPRCTTGPRTTRTSSRRCGWSS